MGISASTSGVSAVPQPAVDAELQSIYQGGENFLARMQALSKRKQDADAAVKTLNLGRDVQAALDDAKAKQGMATDALAKAQADAQQIIDGATAKAKGLIDDATKRVVDSDENVAAKQAQANDMLSAARQTVADATQQAAGIIAQANAEKAKSAQIVADAQAKSDAADKAVAEANKATARAKAAEEKFNSNLKILQTAVSSVMT